MTHSIPTLRASVLVGSDVTPSQVAAPAISSEICLQIERAVLFFDFVNVIRIQALRTTIGVFGVIGRQISLAVVPDILRERATQAAVEIARIVAEALGEVGRVVETGVGPLGVRMVVFTRVLGVAGAELQRRQRAAVEIQFTIELTPLLLVLNADAAFDE